jgi:hypothetical protein
MPWVGEGLWIRLGLRADGVKSGIAEAKADLKTLDTKVEETSQKTSILDQATRKNAAGLRAMGATASMVGVGLLSLGTAAKESGNALNAFAVPLQVAGGGLIAAGTVATMAGPSIRAVGFAYKTVIPAIIANIVAVKAHEVAVTESAYIEIAAITQETDAILLQEAAATAASAAMAAELDMVAEAMVAEALAAEAAAAAVADAMAIEAAAVEEMQAVSATLSPVIMGQAEASIAAQIATQQLTAAEVENIAASSAMSGANGFVGDASAKMALEEEVATVATVQLAGAEEVATVATVQLTGAEIEATVATVGLSTAIMALIGGTVIGAALVGLYMLYRYLNDAKDATKAFEDKIKSLESKIGDLRSVISTLTYSTNQIQDAFDATKNAIRGDEDAIQNLTEEYDSLNKAMESQLSLSNQIASAEINLASYKWDLKDANEAYAEAAAKGDVEEMARARIRINQVKQSHKEDLANIEELKKKKQDADKIVTSETAKSETPATLQEKIAKAQSDLILQNKTLIEQQKVLNEAKAKELEYNKQIQVLEFTKEFTEMQKEGKSLTPEQYAIYTADKNSPAAIALRSMPQTVPFKPTFQQAGFLAYTPGSERLTAASILTPEEQARLTPEQRATYLGQNPLFAQVANIGTTTGAPNVAGQINEPVFRSLIATSGGYSNAEVIPWQKTQSPANSSNISIDASQNITITDGTTTERILQIFDSTKIQQRQNLKNDLIQRGYGA